MPGTAVSRVQKEIDAQSLALELARNEVGMRLPVKELLEQLDVDEQYFLKLAADPLFRKQVAQFKKELEENGVSFQLKARIQAEEMLKQNWRLVHDPDTPAAVVVKAIENTVRWAGLEPKTTQNGAQSGTQPAFTIVFNVPEPVKPPVIDVISSNNGR